MTGEQHPPKPGEQGHTLPGEHPLFPGEQHPPLPGELGPTFPSGHTPY